MSFLCQFCGKPQLPGIKPERVVMKVRVIKRGVKIINLMSAQYMEHWQIAKEQLACPSCAKIPREPEIVAG